MNAKQIWQTIVERIHARVDSESFRALFQGTSGLSLQDDVLVVSVPTPLVLPTLERRYSDTIRSLLREITGTPLDIEFVVKKEIVKPQDLSQEADADIFSIIQPPHRLPKSRPSAAQRRKRIADATQFAATQSSPPPTPFTLPFEDNDEYDGEHDGAEEFETSMPTATHSQVAEAPAAYSGAVDNMILTPRYTFSMFIVGKSNQLAHATSLAVAENPGRVYNPLFLYGGVGLGKTHLLHAVGHACEARGLTVLYVTSEKFTNEIVNAIRFKTTEEFRAKYRQIDILLVDDIQFIAGKESTEEEFFHTFNTLHNANKQIVVTSDRPPKAIHSLQDRLRSRFEWGLLADIQAPEYEHRLAILRSKAESLHFAIPSAVLEFVARPECSSVRELEGALNRVIAYATLHDAPLTVGIAAQALEHIYNDKKPTASLTVGQVLDGVSRYYNIDIAMLRGKQRDREIVWPRQVAMYLMREETTASLLQIGTELGGRDHTTIMHGWEKVHSEIENNDRVRHEIAAVLESLQHFA